MRKRRLLHLTWPRLVLFVVVVGIILLPGLTAEAQGPPPDRPDSPPTHPNPPPDRPSPPQVDRPAPPKRDGGEAGDVSPIACSGVYGFVVDWGYRNAPKMPVELSGGGWQTLKYSDDNGYYAFECLRPDIGVLNLILPEELSPMTTDVAIRLGFREGFEVNLGLYGGELTPSPPVVPVMALSDVSVPAGETIAYTIRVANTLGTPSESHVMGDVLVTDLLPEGLTPVRATSTVGSVELWGNLLTADIGELSAGQEATITLIAKVERGILPGSKISNRASLIHAGHVAVQTQPVTVIVKAAK